MPDATALLAELSAALSDVVAALERRDTGDGIAEIASMLGDLVVAIEKRETGHDGLIEAIRAIRMPDLAPQINVQPTPVRVENKVNVNPTPVTVEAVMPPAPTPVVHVVPPADQKGATWEIRIPGAYGAPPRVLTITRTS